MSLTKSQETAQNVISLLRARQPLIWIATSEEARVESHLFEAAKSNKMFARTWDVAQGVLEESGKPALTADETRIGGDDPDATLAAILERTLPPTDGNIADRNMWIMRDLPVWLQGAPAARTLRALRNLSRAIPTTGPAQQQAVIVLSPSKDLPAELRNHATVIDWPIPDRAEIASILDATVEKLPEKFRADALPGGIRELAIDAAIGLSGSEAAACYAKSLVAHKRIDPVAVAAEKKNLIARDGLLEWHDPLPGGLSSVGGLDLLKGWLESRKAAYSPKAKAYGLPAPKGLVLVGVPGCGKSLSAKAIATAFGMPCIRIDMGALKSKFVGESEANLRRAIQIIEALGRVVVWIDEVEKAMQGATGGGSLDGGVSADALGTILNWMQERKGEAFVVATANDVTQLPPELLRKGRFDEVFAVDLPNEAERVEIILAALKANGRGDAFQAMAQDLHFVVSATKDFTGAEIAALVPDAMFAAFADGERQIQASDMVECAKATQPLAKTAPEKIEAIRKWVQGGRARKASSPMKAAAFQAGGMQLLDI